LLGDESLQKARPRFESGTYPAAARKDTITSYTFTSYATPQIFSKKYGMDYKLLRKIR
jgi:hypothetical protein